ncbi:MAG: hypothetical protein HY258_06160 [Chloroflexi bacterium]|nr:hypothetical protein [Chloroflexota bacterium]
MIREAQLAILEEDWHHDAKVLEAPLEDFKKNYHINLKFPPKPTLKVGSRAANVLSKLLDGLSDQYPNPVKSLARFGRVSFGILHAFLQNNFGYSIFRTILLKKESKPARVQADNQSPALDAQKGFSKIN